MGSAIDIHPHVIASDTRRHPLAPLGGHQSDWSRLRPVGFEQMIAPASEGSLAEILAEAKAALAPLPRADRDWIFFRTAQALYPALADR